MAANPFTESTPALLTLSMIRKQYVPLGARTIFRMISAGKFPKADIASGGKIRLWRRETIQQWIDEQAGN
jgi:predicted DNA-binding transcriptional regulator AlpA